jgi:hypothetical protein
MPTQSALAALQAGIEPDASAARARTKGREVVNLSEADVRKLLTIAAAGGDRSVMGGNRLERLGRAEATLRAMAQKEGVTPAELLAVLRDTAPITPALFEAVAAGDADPAEALASPGRTEQGVKLDQAEAAAAAEQQAELEIPEAVLAKFTEALSNFATPADREPALQVLQQAMGLSKPASYAIATAVLFAE